MPGLNDVRKSYSTDLTDEQFELIEFLLPPANNLHGGCSRKVNMREVVNTILYLNRTVCQCGLMNIYWTGYLEKVISQRLIRHRMSVLPLNKESLTRQSHTGCSCTRQSMDELPTRLLPSGMSSYK